MGKLGRRECLREEDEVSFRHTEIVISRSTCPKGIWRYENGGQKRDMDWIRSKNYQHKDGKFRSWELMRLPSEIVLEKLEEGGLDKDLGMMVS